MIWVYDSTCSHLSTGLSMHAFPPVFPSFSALLCTHLTLSSLSLCLYFIFFLPPSPNDLFSLGAAGAEGCWAVLILGHEEAPSILGKVQHRSGGSVQI